MNVIVIPCYNPSELELRQVIENIYSLDFAFYRIKKIILVNDGSDNDFFKNKSDFQYKNLEIIHHVVNQGKGAAIKSAVKAISFDDDIHYLLTVDCDGQHSILDIVHLLTLINTNRNPNAIFYFGERNFDYSTTPIKSYLGNKIISLIVNSYFNLNLMDTQMGLRAYPKEIFSWMSEVKVDRYEFEMAVFLKILSSKTILFKNFSCQKIYINNNQNTHFRLFKDSFTIMKVILMYFVFSKNKRS